MTLFLNGGGSGEQTTSIYEVFKRNIDTSKPLLYIPFAMPNEKYSGCFEWISEELAQINFPKIDMVISAEEITKRNLSNYKELSYKATVIALPEECTLVITNNRVSVIGTKDYYLFKKGERIKQISNNLYTTSEFLALTDAQS